MTDAQLAFCRWIQQQPERQVTVRQVQQHLSWARTADDARKALALLAKAELGYWRPVSSDGKPGPKCRVFELREGVDVDILQPEIPEKQKSQRTRTLSQKQKFEIAHRDDFTCLFCGDRPGNTCLEIDHLVPVSKGGSDNRENLITACEKCNRQKSDMIVFPRYMCEGPDSLDPRWTVHKSFGQWQVKFCPFDICLEYTPYAYWIESRRVHESDWWLHIAKKRWSLPHTQEDIANGLQYMRQLVEKQ